MQSKTYSLAYFVSHPIQYQAPLLKQLSAQQDIDLQVFFLTDLSNNTYQDQGFNQAVEWDTPLLEGYQYTFLDSSLKDSEFSLFNPKVSLNSVKKVLKSRKWDAIWLHGYNNTALLYALWYAVRSNTPLFFRCDATLVSSKSRLVKDQFIQWLVKNASALLWSSSDNKDFYQFYGATEKQLYFSPHAVDNDFFQSFISARPKRNLSKEKCILLFASKFTRRKNAPLLLDAFNQLAPTIRSQAELWFVGDGEDRPRLEASIRQYGLQESVVLTGFKNQSQIPIVLSQCDVFILPSHTEPFGLIINEAMNLAKAIITTDEVGAARDLVEHGVNGWVIPANNVAALSAALTEAISRKQQLLRMGEKSLSKINQWSFAEDIHSIRAALIGTARVTAN